jgi:hypothetical protein
MLGDRTRPMARLGHARTGSAPAATRSVLSRASERRHSDAIPLDEVVAAKDTDERVSFYLLPYRRLPFKRWAGGSHVRLLDAWTGDRVTLLRAQGYSPLEAARPGRLKLRYARGEFYQVTPTPRFLAQLQFLR